MWEGKSMFAPIGGVVCRLFKLEIVLVFPQGKIGRQLTIFLTISWSPQEKASFAHNSYAMRSSYQIWLAEMGSTLICTIC